MKEQAILKNISKGATLLLAGMAISKICTYFFRIIIARYFGADIYGLFSIGLAVIGILLTLSLIGIPTGILMYVSYYRGKHNTKAINNVINNAFKIILPLSLLFALLLFIFARWISIFLFHNPDMINMLRIFSFAIPVSAIATGIEYVFLAFQKIKYVVIARNIVEPLSKVIFSLIAIFMGYKLIGLTWVYVFSVLTATLLMVYLLKNIISFRKIALAPPIFFKQLLFFSIPLMFSELFILILAWSDTLILGYFVPAVQVGIYNAAVPTAKLISTIPVALMTLFMPIISGMYARKEDFSSIYYTINKWMFLVGIPSVMVLGIYSKQLLSILFGKVFVEGYVVLILIAISFFLYSLMLTSESILTILKKTKLILLNSSLTVLLNLILNILFIPLYGLVGAAIATSFAFLMMSILIAVETYYFTKLTPFKPVYIRGLISAAIPFVLLFYFNRYINTYTLFGLAFLIFVYFALYILLLKITCALGVEEINLLKMAWQKVKGKF